MRSPSSMSRRDGGGEVYTLRKKIDALACSAACALQSRFQSSANEDDDKDQQQYRGQNPEQRSATRPVGRLPNLPAGLPRSDRFQRGAAVVTADRTRLEPLQPLQPGRTGYAARFRGRSRRPRGAREGRRRGWAATGSSSSSVAHFGSATKSPDPQTRRWAGIRAPLVSVRRSRLTRGAP